MEDGFNFEEIQFPEMLKEWQKDKAHEYGLKQLYFGSIDEMKLSHDAGYPQSQKCQDFDYDDDDVGFVVFQFSVPVVEKNCQVDYVGCGEDVADAVGGEVGGGQFNEDERVGDQDEDDVEDYRALLGVDSDVDGEEKGDVSDDKFSDGVEGRVPYHEDSDGY